MVYVTYHKNYSSKKHRFRKHKLRYKKPFQKKIKKIYHLTKDDLVQTAHEYSQNSSLHGLRYVGNKDLHVVERLFWIISFTLAGCASGYFIKDLLQKWYDMPVIMSLSSKSTSLTTIPFPAITICNMNNVRKSVAEQILTSNTSNLERTLLEDFCEEDTLLGSTTDDNTTSSWQQVQNFMIKNALEWGQSCVENTGVEFFRASFIINEKFVRTKVIEHKIPHARIAVSIPQQLAICKILAKNLKAQLVLQNLISSSSTQSYSSYHENFTLFHVSQPCHEMILSCKWHGEQQNCYEIFNSALTDEGMCCSFNKIKNELIFRNPYESHFSDLNITFPFTYIDWTPERGYPTDAQLNHIPWRPWGAGSHLGLTIVLNAELDEYYCASEASHGFKVTLHNPVETPKISAFGTLIRPGSETQVIIQPIINLASLQLMKINQDKRQCFFSDEKVLRFYRTYTQRNCILECESNFTLYFCQCVMYYMPKDSTTRICSKEDIPCANRAKLAMETKLGWLHMNATKRRKNSQKPNCGCLPACFSIAYEKKESSSDISPKYKVKDPYYFRKNMAIVHFFFTDSQFTSTIKGELFGTTELLSGTGGLLGLFMGFSFLSVFEAVYFLTLRLWCSIRKKQKYKNNDAFKLPQRTMNPFLN